jgi:hypothetical protein
MSELGQKGDMGGRLDHVCCPSKADIHQPPLDVCFVPPLSVACPRRIIEPIIEVRPVAATLVARLRWHSVTMPGLAAGSTQFRMRPTKGFPNHQPSLM